MEILFHPAAIWFFVGLAFFLLEFALPGLILFFFAIGAWAAGGLTLIYDVSLNFQLLVFLFSALGTIVVFRKGLKNRQKLKDFKAEGLLDEFTGKSGKALTAIAPGKNGKVEFKGTTWEAQSEDTIGAGDMVIIIENVNILLIVKSTKNLS